MDMGSLLGISGIATRGTRASTLKGPLASLILTVAHMVGYRSKGMAVVYNSGETDDEAKLTLYRSLQEFEGLTPKFVHA